MLDGYCVGRTKDTPARVIVGKEWWDGVSKGTPPTLYNAVMVTPRNAHQSPPLWQTHVVMTGTLQVTKSPDAWASQGIVSLHDAIIGVPGSGNQFLIDGGPFLSLDEEAVILIAFLLFTLGWKRPGQGRRLPAVLCLLLLFLCLSAGRSSAAGDKVLARVDGEAIMNAICWRICRKISLRPPKRI